MHGQPNIKTIVVTRNEVSLYHLLHRRAFVQWFICTQADIRESCDWRPKNKHWYLSDGQIDTISKSRWNFCYRWKRNLDRRHKHQGLDPLIRSFSRVTTALANVSSVFQLFSFLVVCSDMISKGFGLVAFFASVKASSVCIHLSCLVYIHKNVVKHK